MSEHGSITTDCTPYSDTQDELFAEQVKLIASLSLPSIDAAIPPAAESLHCSCKVLRKAVKAERHRRFKEIASMEVMEWFASAGLTAIDPTLPYPLLRMIRATWHNVWLIPLAEGDDRKALVFEPALEHGLTIEWVRRNYRGIEAELRMESSVEQNHD